MLTRTVSFISLVISFAALSTYPANTAEAAGANVKYWLVCSSCNPNIDTEAKVIIQNEIASTPISTYGVLEGPDNGDEVILQSASTNAIATWKILNNQWNIDNSVTLTCDADFCVDATPGCPLAQNNPDWICPDTDRPELTCDATLTSGNNNFLVSWGPNGGGLIDYYTIKKNSVFYMTSSGYGGECINWNQCDTSWTAQASGPGGNSGLCFMQTFCGGGGVPRSVTTMASPVETEAQPIVDILLGN